jgi:ParB family chromosome partitioning protein
VLLPVRSSEEPNPVHRVQLEEPKYTIEQVGAKVGKAPAYVASRARLTELIPAVIEAFYAEEIGVGQSSFSSPMHALSAGD